MLLFNLRLVSLLDTAAARSICRDPKHRCVGWQRARCHVRRILLASSWAVWPKLHCNRSVDQKYCSRTLMQPPTPVHCLIVSGCSSQAEGLPPSSCQLKEEYKCCVCMQPRCVQASLFHVYACVVVECVIVKFRINPQATTSTTSNDQFNASTAYAAVLV
jgi:hypothetical protein